MLAVSSSSFQRATMVAAKRCSIAAPRPGLRALAAANHYGRFVQTAASAPPQYSIVECPQTKSQKLFVTLQPGEAIQTETDAVTMSRGPVLTRSNPRYSGAMFWIEGYHRRLKTFTNEGEKETNVELGSVFGGNCCIDRVDLKDGQHLYFELGGLLCAPSTMRMKSIMVDNSPWSNEWLRNGSHVRLEGPGPVFIRGSGALNRIELGAGEQVHVPAEEIIAYSGTHSEARQEDRTSYLFSPKMSMPFIVTLTGPGTIWRQPKLAPWQELTWKREHEDFLKNQIVSRAVFRPIYFFGGGFILFSIVGGIIS